MGSVMHDLSISSQSSDYSLPHMDSSNGVVRSSTPLKRPSSDALGTLSDHNRVDVLRVRTSQNAFSDKPINRLTLPHTSPSVAEQKVCAQPVSSQVRTIRTVSRFFLSQGSVKKKDEAPPPPSAKENTTIDSLLLAQKDRQTDKVLQGMKAKFGMAKPVRKSILRKRKQPYFPKTFIVIIIIFRQRVFSNLF
jgi:hypothetical protein